MQREKIAVKYKWDLTPVYKSEKEFENALNNAEKFIDFAGFKNDIGTEEKLLNFFKKEESVSKLVERLYLYAHMKADENAKNSVFRAYLAKAESLCAKFSSETSFAAPYLISLPEETLLAFSKSEKLKDYDYMLCKLIAEKKHVLSENEEKLLAQGSEVFSSFKNIFTLIDNADLDFGEITDKKGKKIKLTHGSYSVLLHGSDRELREKAFKKLYGSYNSFLNTISAVYFSSVKKDVYLAKAKRFESCLNKALIKEDVDPVVYKNLLHYVSKNLKYMHKYVKLRKKALKLDKMHMYDMYAPIVKNAELKLKYEEAYALVKKGLMPLGADYAALLDKAYNEGWIDVYENEGKRSGAYSTGIYEAHPYVLLNYVETTHDVFTIAHEMGHAIHSHYANQAQPYSKADYAIFVAEVASTVNEVLLLNHVLSETKSQSLKKYLLSYYLDMIRTTLFRQTMFSEFEFLAHEAVENGTPLTKDGMSETYYKLNKKYYGSAVVHDKEIAFEWCRIPHFYSSFYVYKYATGIISAICIAKKILNKEENAAENYFNFLKSGGKTNPVDILKLAGVDLTAPKPFEEAMGVFRDILKQLEVVSK